MCVCVSESVCVREREEREGEREGEGEGEEALGERKRGGLSKEAKEVRMRHVS